MTDHRTAQAEGWRKVAVGDAKAWKARAEKAEAENERLRETLDRIARQGVGLWSGERMATIGHTGEVWVHWATLAQSALASDESHFACETCQDEGEILVPDEREAPTYESGPHAASKPCPDCALASRDSEQPK